MKPLQLTILFVTTLIAVSVNAQNKSINEAKFVSIGGIEQWITIKGNDVAKPMILFLHGGPGSVMSPYDNIYDKWEEEFILINWDQRGAGRTFGRNAPADVNEDYWIENPLTIEQITADGIELSEYLVKRFGKKIILMGTSWGSILGVKMASKRPDLFYAYIGHSQVVNPAETLVHSYHKVFEMAKKTSDQTSIEKLESIGLPPYAEARNAGQLFRIIKKYERNNSTPAPDTWWKLTSEYDNEKDSKDRENGDDYSFVNYVGFKKLGIEPMMSGVDLMKDNLEFKIPVYLIQGEEDILTPKEITKPYFDKITAPEKKFFVLPKTAHGHNQSVVDLQYKVAVECLVGTR
jgi:pimeloyl-ACP methyl ester carboxylesterase